MISGKVHFPINDFSFFTGVEKSPLAPYTDGNGDSRATVTTISSPGDAAASAAAAWGRCKALRGSTRLRAPAGERRRSRAGAAAAAARARGWREWFCGRGEGFLVETRRSYGFQSRGARARC